MKKMSYSPAEKTLPKVKENIVNGIRNEEKLVSGMNTKNRKILMRGSSICLDDKEFDQIYHAVKSGQCENTQRDHEDKENMSNFPDVVSNISQGLQSEKHEEEYNDPDIVCSKSFNIQASADRNVNQSKLSRVMPGSVSSFSSSSCSKQSTSSFERKSKTSTVSSVGSFDNDEQQNEVFFTKNDATNCVFNQDSVFAQDSEDIFNQSQQYRRSQPFIISSHITSPIMESHSSHSTKEDDITNVVVSSDRVQKARSRYSSSGYGTGSGGSAQEGSASKTSIHSTQVSFSESNAVISQGTQTSTLRDEELYFVKNKFISRNINPCTPMVNNVVCTCIKSQVKQLPGEPLFENQSSCNIVSAGASPVSEGIQKCNFPYFSEGVICVSSTSSESQTSGHMKQQALYKQNVSMDVNSLQVQKQSQCAPLNLSQGEMNVVDTAAHSHLRPAASSCSISQQQPSVVNKNSNTPYTSSPHHLSAPSLPSRPITNGSLNYNHSQTSTFSSESCFISPDVEALWIAEKSPASFIKHVLLQSGSGASESFGDSQYHLDSLMKNDLQVNQAMIGASQNVHSISPLDIPRFDELLPESFSSAMMSSLEGQFDKSLMVKLQRSVRCYEADCPFEDCKQIKKAMTMLQNPRINVNSLCETDKLLLLTMFRHTVDMCDYSKCPFPWCEEHMNNIKLSQEKCLLVMKHWMENFAEHFLFLDSPRSYMRLKPALPYESIPVEGRDWVRLCMLGTSRRALLVQPVKSEISGLSSDSEYWVIKKVSTTNDGDNWGVYSRLRDVSHNSVVTLLWAASFDDHMLVCSLYEQGFTLHECLPLHQPQQFLIVQVLSMMMQLISALRHLNKLGIAYLYWTSKNILVTYTSSVDFLVKLSNFSCSVLLEPPEGKQSSYDGGHLLLALPRHIITPELRDNIRVDYVSDVWGLGCLLNELVTGYPVWYEHRHTLDNEFKLLTLNKPPVPTICPELMNVFTACWEIDSSKRIQLSDLEMMLIKAYQVQLIS